MANDLNYNLHFSSDLPELQRQIKQVGNSIKNLSGSGGNAKLDGGLSQIEKALGRISEKSLTSIGNLSQIDSIGKDVDTVAKKFELLGQQLESLSKLSASGKAQLISEQYVSAVDAVDSFIGNTPKLQKALRQREEAILANTRACEDFQQAQAALEKAPKPDTKEIIELDKRKKAIDELIEVTEKYDSTKTHKGKTLQEGDKTYSFRRAKKAAGADAPEVDVSSKNWLSSLREKSQSMEQQLSELKGRADEYSKLAQAAEAAKKALEDTAAAQKKADAALTGSQKSGETIKAWNELTTALKNAGLSLKDIGVQGEYSEIGLRNINEAITDIENGAAGQFDQLLESYKGRIVELAQEIAKLVGDFEKGKNEAEEFDKGMKDVRAITSRIEAYVGLQGAINLTKSAVQRALSTIKELDQTMAEMSVVTDENIGGYWDKLPTYTKRANELGVAINDVYEADMLLYQQGLNATQVVEISTEALKMARIAGLDAEEATNRLTSAIRGFGMELDQTSAQRVSDVYSELAAISASDVDELSTAMSKTASIASSAGASFENTSAFLAQMIETTREAPDAIGTSLKTVVARFTELKKAPSEIGEVDGEIVDANAIETALRSVGIALRDEVTGQFRDFDDIILELAAKWDTLDSNTQHYIATVSAGSRQQSRFLALLSDYDRLLELTTAAEGAAGASNEQYQKTLDSLESKLNALANAWDTFTMGITDDKAVKGLVDLGTAAMNAVNDITDLFGSFSGVAKIGVMTGGLKLASNALKTFSESFKETHDLVKSFGKGIQSFGKSFQTLGRNVKKGFSSLKNVFKKKDVGFDKVDIEQTKKMETALKSYTNAEKKLNAVETERKAAQEAGTLTEAAKIKLDERSARASTQRANAQSNYISSLKFTESQQKQYNALTELGIGIDTAAKYAKEGITAADVKRAAEIWHVNEAELTEEQIRSASTASLFAQTLAKGANALASNLEAKGDTGAALAKWLHKQANDALNGSLLATLALLGPLALAIGAVIGIGYGVVKLVENINSQKPSEKLKAAQGATRAAADAAKEAADSYENLNTSFSELASKYSALKNLTKGTEEWKTATQEINDDVMSLVGEYKELAKYVTYEGGVMTLDLTSDGTQQVLDKYETQATNAKIAEQSSKVTELGYQADANVEESDIMKRKNTENLIGSIFTGALVSTAAMLLIAGAVASGGLAAPALAAGAGAVTTALIGGGVAAGAGTAYLLDAQANLNDEQYLEKQAKLFSNNSLYIDENGEVQIIDGKEEEFEDLAKELGFIDSKSALLSLKGYSEKDLAELQILGENYRQVAEYQESVNEIIRGQMKDLIDTSTKAKAENNIIDTLSRNKDITARYQEEALEEVKNLTESEFQAEMRNIYGDTFEKEGEDYYVNGEKLNLSKENLQAQLASVKAANKVADALEDLATEVLNTANGMKDSGNTEEADAFKRLFSKDEGAGLTANTIEKAKGIEWEQLGASAKAYFGSEEEYKKWRDQQVKNAQETLETAQDRVGRALGGESFKFSDENLDVGALGSYAGKLEKIGFASNSQGVKQVMSMVDELTAGMTTEETTRFLEQISAFDWSNMANWDDLPATLEALGVAVPLDKLDDFISKTSELAQATYQVDFSSLTESLYKTAKIIKDMRSGVSGRVIDETTYEQILNSDADFAKQFTQNLDGEYVYIGGKMDNLADKLEVLSTEAARITRENLGEQYKVGSYLGSEEGEHSKIYLGQLLEQEDWTGDELKEAQNKIVEILNASGVKDYSKLGIEGFTNSTVLSNIFTEDNEEMARSIVQAIFGYFTNAGTIKTNIDTYNTSISAVSRQTKDASLNQGMSDSYSAALVAQASTAGANTELINDYTESLQKYNKMSNKSSIGAVILKKRIEQLGQQIVNSTNIINRDANIVTSIENVTDLAESYGKAATEAQKMAIAGQMASDFNLKVTKENYEEVGKYLTDYAYGDYNSFMGIINESAKQAGISFGKINSTTWTEDVLAANKTYQDFFDMLIARGAGAFDAAHKWIWTTQQEFNALAEDAAADKWENSYDWIYNYTEQVNALTREREKLERKFEKTLENEKYTAEELRDITLEEVDTLKRRANMSGDAALKAQKEIETLFDTNSKFSDYLVYNQASGAITANYPALNDITNQAFGEDFDDFIGKLEELRDTYQDAVDDLEDIEDDLEELSKRGRDEYSESIDKVQEALIDSYQDIIDERTELSSAIKEAQDAIVDRMQEQIDATRQARENEKTESDLSDRRLRLAALMRDTSGSNAAEIKNLRKEIEDAETDYTDSLVDQALERLQDANEKAAEQREKQIELAQAQLDAYNESDFSYDDAQQMLKEAFNSIDSNEIFGEAFMSTPVGELLKKQRDAMNSIAEEDWTKEIQEGGALANLYDRYHGDIQNEIDKVQAEIDTYEEKIKNIDGFLGNENIANRLKGDEPYSIKLDDGSISSNTSEISETTKSILNALEEKQEEEEEEKDEELYKPDGRGGFVSRKPVFTDDAENYSSSSSASSASRGSTLDNRKHMKYATGGLADYTGPAWVDGTPTKPELVLNSTDTANFIVLKDILSSLLNGDSFSSTDGRNGGDNYYDIAISVDSLGDDYDVEQMVEKVRNMIYEDSIYRNVNTIHSVK